MEENITTFFDPIEKPFGPLSIYFREPLVIDGKTYNSIANYVYSLVVKIPMHKKIILESPSINLINIRNELLYKTKESILKSSLDKALRVKFTNPELAKRLLDTGLSHLIFRSPNVYLGVNEAGVGQNILGMALMKLRSEIQQMRILNEKLILSEELYTKIYNIYLLYNIMLKKITNGVSDLSEYMNGYDINDVINKYGRSLIQSSSPSKDAIIELYKNKYLPDEIKEELKRPGVMPYVLRSKYLAEYSQVFNKKVHDFIFSEFCNKVAEKSISEKVTTTGKYDFVSSLNKLDKSERNTLKERVLKLYIYGILPNIKNSVVEKFGKDLISQNDIDDAIRASLNIDMEDEEVIDEDEAEQLASHLEEADDLKQVTIDKAAFDLWFEDNRVFIDIENSTVESGNLVNVAREMWNKMNPLDKDEYIRKIKKVNDKLKAKNQLFDPAYDVIQFSNDFSNENTGFLSNNYPSMMLIDYMNFPSVSHFVFANLFMTLSYVNTLVQSHTYLLADSVNGNRSLISSYKRPEIILDEYETRVQEDILKLTIEGCKKAINSRFSSQKMKSLLLATGDSVLVFEDYNDPVLGVGRDRQGLNAYGVELHKLRENLRAQGNVEAVVVEFKQTPTLRELTKNPEVMKWFEERTSNVIESIKFFMKYLNIDIENISPPIVNFVVFDLYKNCASIFDKYKDITDYPKTFEAMVKFNFGKERIPKSVIKILWKYMSLMTTYLLEEYVKQGTPLTTFITGINDYISINSECKGPYSSNENNCTLGAILTILEKLKRFKTRDDAKFSVGLAELEFVFNLLTPTGYRGQLEEALDMPDIPSIKKTSIINSNKIISYFRDNGIILNPSISRIISKFINDLSYDIKTLSRVYFYNNVLNFRKNAETFK